MNLPNKITVFRIFMIPFFVACMLIKEIPYNEIIAGVIFIIAALSDLVDGKIARHYNAISPDLFLGKRTASGVDGNCDFEQGIYYKRFQACCSR